MLDIGKTKTVAWGMVSMLGEHVMVFQVGARFEGISASTKRLSRENRDVLC
jgi:hypothetical protein